MEPRGWRHRCLRRLWSVCPWSHCRPEASHTKFFVLQKLTPQQIRQLILYYYYVKNELTDLRENRLLQNDFKNNLCGINLEVGDTDAFDERALTLGAIAMGI